MIDRADHCMNLCKIKFYNSERFFNSDEARKVLFRRERFREKTKTRKTLFKTLTSTYGAKENGSYLGAFDNQLTLDALFE
ncbi:hypothetical protein NEPTK9_001785 [Candidatus Neptunochlamydia vexilliferae]|uniref:Uncharacterized protein n=1 Tax=Candidatus Neptunichlamydia vexilliferae TaxID=1651774 RepID=A0ABS0B1K0_9BACT|nr:hypothetical protein [Candidatus Neptunochlamydia vexilliferae]